MPAIAPIDRALLLPEQFCALEAVELRIRQALAAEAAMETMAHDRRRGRPLFPTRGAVVETVRTA